MRSKFFFSKFRTHGFKFMGIALLLAIILVACQKSFEPSLQTGEFNSAAAKEWYYSTFKKSPEWVSYYSNTKSKASNKAIWKKLPDWKNGKYQNVGNIEIVEFPLVKALKTVPIISQPGLSNEQKKKIAEASLSRIAFFKKDGRILVREISYIPDWAIPSN